MAIARPDSGRHVALLILALALGACSTLYLQPQSRLRTAPALYDSSATMADGYVLPLHFWGSRQQPRALVLGLHGFNDYGTSIASLGEHLAPTGVLTVSYDQRGFGATTYRGRWPGVARLVDDLACMLQLLHERYPGLPIHVFGESMGGALVMTAAAQGRLVHATDLILAAPAVWGRETMNPFVRFALWVGANVLPGLHLTGEGLKIMASDNRAMLLGLGRDPLVIKRTRIDAVNGLTDLMDAALTASQSLHIPTLVLYGAKDQVIPMDPICRFAADLHTHGPGVWQMLTYPNGYHMLTRDLQREVVLRDIERWIAGPASLAQRHGDPSLCKA
jgi:acylglycerol lipase